MPTTMASATPQALQLHYSLSYSLTDDNSRHMPIPLFVPFTLKHNSINAITTTSCAGFETPPTQKPKRIFQPNNHSSATVADFNTLCRKGRLKEALGILDIMDQQGISADSEIYASLLDTCASRKALPEGKQVHAHMLMSGVEQKLFIGAKLVSMYATCGSMEIACLVFDKMPKRNVLLWNGMIRGYVKNGLCKEALGLYHQMQSEGVQPNKFTFPFVLNACAGISALQQGNAIHDHIIRIGLESDIFVGNALVDMYAKCGNVRVAREVFDRMPLRDLVSWNAIISGYAQNGHAIETLKLFRQMQMDGVKPDPITLTTVLSACSHIRALQQGKEIHGHIIRGGFESEVFVGSALVDMYSKCRSTEVASAVFAGLSVRDVVLWNAMITGYAQNGYANEAIKLFRQMQSASMKPSLVTIASVLRACAALAALQQGKEIHDCIIKRGLELNVIVGSALVDMYAKCGNVEIARLVFDKMSKRDVILWTSMIAGCGMHGHGRDALTLFHHMEQAGLKPDQITFTAVLAACSHAGLVSEGLECFDSMTQYYKIKPEVEHYTCMVDLLGRAGQLDEAYEFIKKMPVEPTSAVWGALLGACRVHCNVELGEHVAKLLFDLEPENPGFYVLLSNIYAAAGRWDGVEKVRTIMKKRGVKKMPGCSWIEVKNKVHAFLAGDKSHPQSDKIHAMLKSLVEQMKEAGYLPDTNFVLDDVEEEEKENILSGHSEKLAIVFGLLNTLPGTPIRITKNLRVCGDCHNATKYISKIVTREIVVRDVNRFHHFKDGFCSCGDYW
eukprot:Gb_17379 [translate_table: standard]